MLIQLTPAIPRCGAWPSDDQCSLVTSTSSNARARGRQPLTCRRCGADLPKIASSIVSSVAPVDTNRIKKSAAPLLETIVSESESGTICNNTPSVARSRVPSRLCALMRDCSHLPHRPHRLSRYRSIITCTISCPRPGAAANACQIFGFEGPQGSHKIVYFLPCCGQPSCVGIAGVCSFRIRHACEAKIGASRSERGVVCQPRCRSTDCR